MRSLLHLLWNGFRLLPAKLRRAWGLWIPLGLLTGGIELIGATLIVATIRVVDDPATLASMPVIGSWRLLPSGADAIVLMAGFVVLFFLFKNLFGLWLGYLRHALLGRSTACFSRLLLERYLDAEYQFHLDHSSADLIKNVEFTTEAVTEYGIGSVAALVQSIAIVLGLWAALMFTAPSLSLAVALLLASAIIAIRNVTKRGIDRSARKVHKARQEILRRTQQLLGAVTEIRLSGRKGYFFDEFQQAQERFVHNYGFAMTWLGSTNMILEVVFGFAAGAMLIALAVSEKGSGAQITPVLGALAYIVFRLIPVSKGIMSHLGNIEYARTHVERMLEHLSLPREHPKVIADVPLRIREALVVDGLAFRYPHTHRAAVHGFSARIGWGESVGLVGPSGAGKTTLMLLLLGLLPPETGRILADGHDIRGNLPGWRRGIGYVSQNVYLLDDTVRRNVALGFADHQIDDVWLERCADMACLMPVIRELPRGMDTLIGENGVRLSGGQRQRMAIARALYHRPELLLLDEATSALDNETERAVTESIRRLHGEITMIIIAHRLTTLRDCDRLLFIEDGRLADAAPFDVLLQRNARFRKMAHG